MLFIIMVILIFGIIVVSLNYDKIKAYISTKASKKTPKPEKPKPVETDKYKDKMSYSEYQPVVVDDLGNPDEKYEVGTLATLNEQEAKELSNNTKGKAGRLRGDIESVKIERVEVEDLGEYDENAGFDDVGSDLDNDTEFDESYEEDDDDFFFFDTPPKKTISQEIRDLSPQLKALLIDNVLSKKDDKK